MKTITMKCGKKVKIDSENSDLLRYKWRLNLYKTKNNVFEYAVRNVWINGKSVLVYLHKEIMSGADGSRYDFINHDTLDCRKENLRLSTHSEDSKNKTPRGKSKYLGVHVHTSTRKYTNKKGDKKIYHSKPVFVAKIKIKNKYKHLGSFKIETDAAKKYNEAAKKHHGEFANLNKLV